jgi:hypothetical protein
MEYLIGVILSLVVAGFAAIVGFDRERPCWNRGLLASKI